MYLPSHLNTLTRQVEELRSKRLDARMRAPLNAKMYKPSFKMLADGEAVIEIDGYIGGAIDYWTWEETGTSAATLAADVKAAGDVKRIRLKINSEGGDALEGIQMHIVLDGAAKRGIEIIVEVGATCMSAATLPAMAGAKIRTAKSSLWLIHDPEVDGVSGNAKALLKKAAELETVKSAAVTIYERNKSMTPDQIAAFMDEAKLITGVEAVAAGWADETTDDQPFGDVSMSFDADLLDRYLAGASDEAKARVAELKITMSATSPDDAEPEEIPSTRLSAIEEKLSAVTDIVSTLTDRVTLLAPKTAPAPAVQPGLDLKDKTVMAIRKVAILDDRAAEFDAVAAAGPTVELLRERFLRPKADATEIQSPGAVPAAAVIAEQPTMSRRGDYFANYGKVRPAKAKKE